ncbi:MAG: hypothetical protein AAF571_05525 [Verrucomicrobiota bacterium]
MHGPSLSAVQPAQVEAHLLTRQILGDISKLDRAKFINVHSSYTSAALTTEDLEQLQTLGVGFGRSFDGPFARHEVGTPYPDTAMIQAKAEQVLAVAAADRLYPYRTTRRITTNEVQTAFNMIDDPRDVARYAADILQFHYTEETRPDFYSPLSIPFVAAGKYGEDQAKVRQRMAQWIAEIGKEFDRRELSTQVIGYTSAWPVMHYWDFGHWRERMQMFMDTAGDYLDGICFILMDATHLEQPDQRRSGSRVEALMDLIETYGAIKWGKPKPFAFSEYGDVSQGWPEGDRYSPARASSELTAYNHFLFSLLGREDRVSIAVPFITTKSPWFYQQPKNEWQPYSADLWRPDPDSIVDNQPTRFLETEKMTFYRLWQGVSGHRTLIQSSDPDIMAYAFVDGADAYLCLNNFEESPRQVSLSLSGELPEVARIELKRLNVPRGKPVRYTKKKLEVVPDRLILQPHETVILCIRYTEVPEPAEYVRTITCYSHNYLLPILADKPLKFSIPAAEVTESSQGTLRVSFAREHDLSKQPRLSVNGELLPFPEDWVGNDQSEHKNGFFGAVAVPVPAGILQPENEVVLTFSDAGGRVSTVVLEVHVPVAVE